jgi:hypothetical protein
VTLIADLPETRATIAIKANAWRLQMLRGDQPSIEEGERIMAATEQIGTLEDILNVRITVATGHGMLAGDVARGARELEAIVEDAIRANSHLVARAYINLASFTGWLGDLRRVAELDRDGLAVTRRFMSGEWALWFEWAIVEDDFYAGEWDRASASARTILDRRAELYMDHALYGVLAVIAAARGDEVTARDQTATLVDRVRAVADPQAVHPSMARASMLALEDGDRARAAEYLDESIIAVRTSTSNITPETVEAAIVAEALGRGPALVEALADAVARTPWADASAAIVEGRFDDAGSILEEHGDLPDAALARLVGAERAGRRTPGLEKAIAFAERVEASAWLARAHGIGAGKA